MTYLYRSFLTPIQFNSTIPCCWPEHRQADRGHAQCDAPSADVVAASSGEGGEHLWAAAGERGRLRGPSERSPIRGFAAYHERFQRYRYRFVSGACMERVAEDRPVVRPVWYGSLGA